MTPVLKTVVTTTQLFHSILRPAFTPKKRRSNYPGPNASITGFHNGLWTSEDANVPISLRYKTGAKIAPEAVALGSSFLYALLAEFSDETNVSLWKTIVAILKIMLSSRHN